MRIAFYVTAITVIFYKALISALLSVLSCVIKCHYGAICWVVFEQNATDCSETVKLHQISVVVLSPNGSTSRFLHCMGGGFLTDIL